MPPFPAPIRTFAAVAVLAIGANIGIASASAKTEKSARSTAHHVTSAYYEKYDAFRLVNYQKYSARHTSKPVVKANAAIATTGSPQPDGVPGKWNLILNSTFDGSSLNTNIWRAGYWGTGVTKPVNSLEDDCYNSNNVSLSGTALDLSVTHQTSRCEGNTYPYTGAIVSTDPVDGRASGGFQYTYGVLQARVYIPAASNGKIANWPAVWAVTPTTQSVYGEDDVVEGLGGQASWHYHSTTAAPGGSDTKLTPGWHTFTSDWQPGSITYYYDGTQVGRLASGIVGEPMYILLDNTVDSTQPSLAGASTMQVQYVRVWQHS